MVCSVPLCKALYQQLPLGLGIAGTIRVGNELGAGNPLRAKRASYTAMGIVGMISFFCDNLKASYYSVFSANNGSLMFTKKNSYLEKHTTFQPELGLHQLDIRVVGLF